MPQKERKRIRLKEYDYGEIGCSFITLCTYNRQMLFTLSPSESNSGNDIIHRWLQYTQKHFPNIHIDQYVIMPDHLHLIINIRQYHMGCSVPKIMQYFKTATTAACIRSVKKGAAKPFEQKLWQKSYYEHVIRNQQDYNEIWEYIQYNPVKWKELHSNKS